MIIPQISPAQAAYRASFSTEDHLFTCTLVMERCAEFNHELWIAVFDFEKAFDSVEHDTMWSALHAIGIDALYIRLLQLLYLDQSATVRAGAESRRFNIARGVRQGDPISALL